MKRTAMLLCAVAILLMGCGNSEVKDSSVDQQDKVSQVYVDLGLSSGTLWKATNEWNSADDQGFYTYDDAVSVFGASLPCKEQWAELLSECTWTWNSSSQWYDVKGPNGNSIVLPASGCRYCDGDVGRVGSDGYYCSSTPYDSEDALHLSFNSSGLGMCNVSRCRGQSVRLVQGK